MEPPKTQKSKRKLYMENLRNNLKAITKIGDKTNQINNKFTQRVKRKSIQIQEQFTVSQYCESPIIIKNSKICQFEQKYIEGDKIGQGAHGIVRKCTRIKTGKEYAVKIMSMEDQQKYFLKRNFADIRTLSHPNIIEYKALYFDLNKYTTYLVMQYVPYPDLLSQAIKNEQTLKNIFYALLDTLIYVHSKSVCHRDIKPENILYDPCSGNIKLIDFGISKKAKARGAQVSMLTITGTLYYRAPEMFLGGGYDQLVDMWALGVTIYKVLTGVTPFQSDYHCQTINNITNAQPTFEEPIWNLSSNFLKDLVSRLLKSRQKRLNATQAKNHLWFSPSIHEFSMTKSEKFDFFQSQQQDLKVRGSMKPSIPSSIMNMNNFTTQNNLQKWINDCNDNKQFDFIESENQDQLISPHQIKTPTQ